jgi:hypothetical protein
MPFPTQQEILDGGGQIFQEHNYVITGQHFYFNINSTDKASPDLFIFDIAALYEQGFTTFGMFGYVDGFYNTGLDYYHDFVQFILPEN